MRVDGFGYIGYKTSPRYDALLAKLIVWHPDGLGRSVTRARRALAEFQISGFSTNLPFLRGLLDTGVLGSPQLHTRYIEQNMSAVLEHLAIAGSEEPATAVASATAIRGS